MLKDNSENTENNKSAINKKKLDSNNVAINPQSKKINPKKSGGLNKVTIWTIKITIITLCLSVVVSFITEIASSKSNVIISILILSILVLISIVFDAIGVSATSCDLSPLLSMASRKVKGATVAVKLVKNAEKVSNICADVVGDMCGIISGSCSAAIVLKFAMDNPKMYLFNILISSLVAALTVGGKAFFKSIALKNSKEMIMLTSRIIGVFYHPKAK
ncbi:MAG: hypothetical protein WCR54_03660 [Clostridia bacterium]